MNQKYQEHGSRHRRCDQQGLDAERIIGNIDYRLFYNGLDPDAPNQKPGGIDALGCTGKQGTIVFTVNDHQVFKFLRGDGFDLIHLVG